MRMTTKSRFAVQSMVDLALRERSGPVALARIAERQGVSLSYLEQLFSRLRRAGLVESTRGPGGGYTLGRRPVDISVADIVAAVEDVIDPDLAAHPRLQPTAALWAELDEVAMRHLATVPLSELAASQRQQQPSDDVVESPRRPASPFAERPLAAAPTRHNVPNSVFAFGQSFAR